MSYQSEYNVGKTSPPPLNSSPSPQKTAQNRPCFTCKKTGHWYQNCPEKSPSEATHPIITTTQKFPIALRCRCGSGNCPIRTSNTYKNPNRDYYNCPGVSAKECGFFKWCDQVKEDEYKNPPQYRFPECACRAGICYLEEVKGGPNDGRKRFVCRIPKGYGACSFSQLFDPQRDLVKYGESESINLITPPLDNQSNSDFSEDEHASSRLLNKRDFESLEIDNPQHSPSPDSISPSKRSNVRLSEGMEKYENAPISPSILHSSLECSFDANAGSANGPTRDLVVSQENICGSIIENTLKSILTSQADVHFCSPQTEFRSQVSFAEGVYPNLESEQLDTIFPSTPKQGARISSQDFHHTNGSEQTNLMKVILERFRQTAPTIQNDLINRLVSMDILDHEDMVRESESVFSILDQLCIENTNFRARVLKFIECSSSQAAVVMSICDDLSSSQKLVDEQELLEILTCTHAELMSELKTAKKRLGALKNKLLQIETQVSDCEAETNNLESQVAGISEKMAMPEKRLEAASMEASKIREQRELERSAAKAALEEAKLQLRQ